MVLDEPWRRHTPKHFPVVFHLNRGNNRMHRMEINRFPTIVSDEISQKESGPSISGSGVGDYEDVFGIERNALILCYIISIPVPKQIRQNFS